MVGQQREDAVSDKARVFTLLPFRWRRHVFRWHRQREGALNIPAQFGAGLWNYATCHGMIGVYPASSWTEGSWGMDTWHALAWGPGPGSANGGKAEPVPLRLVPWGEGPLPMVCETRPSWAH